MTPLDVLNKVKSFTEEHIAPFLLMRKEPKKTGDIMTKPSDTETPEFVHPAVEIGTIPHKNFQPLEFQCPMILWTFDETTDAGTYDEGRIVRLRANVSAYTSGLYKENTLLPDNRAFIDLVNVLEKIYQEITKKNVINGVGIMKPITYGIYDGVFYPYAYGYLTLTAEITRIQYDDEIFLEDC